jgi:hypothetical protein
MFGRLFLTAILLELPSAISSARATGALLTRMRFKTLDNFIYQIGTFARLYLIKTTAYISTSFTYVFVLLQTKDRRIYRPKSNYAARDVRQPAATHLLDIDRQTGESKV